jgi:hypothetical protein
MSKQPKVYHLEFPVLNHYNVHVEFTSDLKKSISHYRETKDIELYSDESGLAIHPKNQPRSFIFFKGNPNPGTIVHESWHVVRRMLEYYGIELDNEVVAYHLGYLVRNIHGMMRGRK